MKIEWTGIPRGRTLEILRGDIKGYSGNIEYFDTREDRWISTGASAPGGTMFVWETNTKYRVVLSSIPPSPTPVPEIPKILAERGSRYGVYRDVAGLAEKIKAAIREGRNYDALEPYHMHSLDMFASKISRIVNGDPNYEDSWVDIAGYAELVLSEIRLNKEDSNANGQAEN